MAQKAKLVTCVANHAGIGSATIRPSGALTGPFDPRVA
jgi:hypothetical protein